MIIAMEKIKHGRNIMSTRKASEMEGGNKVSYSDIWGFWVGGQKVKRLLGSVPGIQKITARRPGRLMLSKKKENYWGLIHVGFF